MLDYSGLTLLIPDKPDSERDAVAVAWQAGGGEVLRLGRFWAPPALERTRVRVYGPETFCLVLAEKLELDLLTPADDLIASVPYELLRRTVVVRDLGVVLGLDFPVFSKPVTPKQFSARVYTSRNDLERETHGLPLDTAVIRSEVVRFEAEARSFLLNGEVLAVSVYEGEAPSPLGFIKKLPNRIKLPPTCVLDVGLIAEEGWAFLEVNAAWGAGLNGCDASLVLPAIERASRLARRE